MTDIVTPPTIDPLPPAPQPTDTPAEFDAKGFATVAAWGPAITQTNAAAAATHQNAVAANERATAAGASAATATTKASEAATSAATAVAKAGEATTARNEAVPAAATAVTARNEAVSAAATAVSARDLALTYRDQAEVFATQQLKATSTTSATPSAGSKTFAIQPSRSFVPGMYLVATSQGVPGTRMSGYVGSYDPATGQLVLDVDAFAGAAARADWVIGVAAPGSAGVGLTTQVVTANTVCVANVAYIVAAAGITLTLPGAWTAGDRIAVIEAIGNGQTYSLNFGSTALRGRALGLQTIPADYSSTGELRYQDTTRGLV